MTAAFPLDPGGRTASAPARAHISSVVVILGLAVAWGTDAASATTPQPPRTVPEGVRELWSEYPLDQGASTYPPPRVRTRSPDARASDMARAPATTARAPERPAASPQARSGDGSSSTLVAAILAVLAATLAFVVWEVAIVVRRSVAEHGRGGRRLAPQTSGARTDAGAGEAPEPDAAAGPAQFSAEPETAEEPEGEPEQPAAEPEPDPDTVATLDALDKAELMSSYLTRRNETVSNNSTEGDAGDATAQQPSEGTAAYVGQQVAGVLASAQEAADRIREEATREAERILGEAQSQAHRTRSEADDYARQVRDEADRHAAEKPREADEYAAATRAQAESDARATREAAERDAEGLEAQLHRAEERILELRRILGSMTSELEEVLPKEEPLRSGHP